jgi:hypothetical protein
MTSSPLEDEGAGRKLLERRDILLCCAIGGRGGGDGGMLRGTEFIRERLCGRDNDERRDAVARDEVPEFKRRRL